MTLQDRVLQAIRNQHLIKPGSTVLVGVSGGADSIVLAHVMSQLRHLLSLRLHIAHFNHGLRKTAHRDEQLVRDFAGHLNVPVIVGCRRPAGNAKAVSEDQAREWRYAFFSREVRSSKAGALVLGHTQNDVAETVLMRIIRGAGLTGLRAIQASRAIGSMQVVRPLLSITRQEVEAYAAKFHLKYHTDETNADIRFLRNKIRLKLLPLLAKEYNSNINGVLSTMAETVGEDLEFLQEALRQRIKENVVSLKGTVTIKAGFLARQPASMRRLVLRYAFEQLTGDLNQVTFAHVAQAEALIERNAPGSVQWPQNVRVTHTRNYLTFAYET